MFFAVDSVLTTDSSSNFVEKRVDSKQELLDFTTTKLNTKKSDISGSKINLNMAELAELMTLPGIGETTAERIIEFRAANGKFTSLEQLMSVKGIGKAKFSKLKELLTIE